MCNSMELISEVLREVSTKVILYNSMAEVLYIDKPLIRQIEQGNSLKKKPILIKAQLSHQHHLGIQFA